MTLDESEGNNDHSGLSSKRHKVFNSSKTAKSYKQHCREDDWD